MTTLDLIIFLVYIISIMGVGGWFFRKNRSSSAFTLGNQSIPGWVVGMMMRRGGSHRVRATLDVAQCVTDVFGKSTKW